MTARLPYWTETVGGPRQYFHEYAVVYSAAPVPALAGWICIHIGARALWIDPAILEMVQP